MLAARWLHERSLASTKSTVTVSGTCGLCLHPAQFTASTAGGEVVERGRMPNWREAMACDCESGLVGRERAALQFVLANIGLPSWSRVLILGTPGTLSAAFCAYAPRTMVLDPHAVWPPRARGGGRLASVGRHHLVLALEVLHVATDPAGLLAAIARLLLPGGHLVFTAPFHSDAETSVFVEGSAGSQVQSIGWDILQMIRTAGFDTASANMFWSEEFGYLGLPNFLFSATRIKS